MKKIMLLFAAMAYLLMVLAPVSVMAQGDAAEKLQRLMENTTPQQRAELEDRWMKKELNLSADQAGKVHDINLQSAEKVQTVYDSDEHKFRKFREIKKIGDEKDGELQQVLSGEQYSAYQAKKEEMREKMQEKKQHQNQ